LVFPFAALFAWSAPVAVSAQGAIGLEIDTGEPNELTYDGARTPY
jgi:hypothetical protein